MSQEYNFENISIPLPKKRIYSRLGYSNSITEISTSQKKIFESYINESLLLLELKARALRIDFKKGGQFKIRFSNAVVFESKLLSSFLEGCQEVLFMAVTTGNKIMEAIKNPGQDEFTRSVVLDAVASETVDAGLDWIIKFMNQELKRENKQLTPRRISCGYGDFPLKYQKEIYNLLKLNKLGIKITNTFMLIPEKSVTALSGIKEI